MILVRSMLGSRNRCHNLGSWVCSKCVHAEVRVGWVRARGDARLFKVDEKEDGGDGLLGWLQPP